MADCLTVDYDLRLGSGGSITMSVEASLHLSDADKKFVLAVLGLVGEFARIASPDAPAPALAGGAPPEPAPERQVPQVLHGLVRGG